MYIATSSDHHKGERAETGQQPAGPEDHLQVRGALEDVHGIGFRHTTRTHGASEEGVARAATEDQIRFLGLKQGRAMRVIGCSLQIKVCAGRVDTHRAISVGVLLKERLRCELVFLPDSWLGSQCLHQFGWPALVNMWGWMGACEQVRA